MCIIWSVICRMNSLFAKNKLQITELGDFFFFFFKPEVLLGRFLFKWPMISRRSCVTVLVYTEIGNSFTLLDELK